MANQPSLFYAKAVYIEKQQRYYLTHKWGYKKIHIFLKALRLKVTVKGRLEIELAY